MLHSKGKCNNIEENRMKGERKSRFSAFQRREFKCNGLNRHLKQDSYKEEIVLNSKW